MSEQQRAFEIAQGIHQQLMTINRIKVWSWGAHAWKYGLTEKKEPYLRFRVKGNHFSGIIHIVHTFADTYRVEFFKGNSKTAEHIADDLYVDNFLDYIDNHVEKIDAYSH